MSYVSWLGKPVWPIVSLLLLAVACGGNSASDNGSTQTTGGDAGSAGSAGSAAPGGTSSGGFANSGGSIAGTTSAGGQSTTGGRTGMGGSVVALGGSSSGGAAPSGGTTVTQGGSSQGGSSQGGATDTGGESSSGGTTPSGGTSAFGGDSSLGGAAERGGASNPDEFCQGDESKVSYQGQVISAPATNYESSLVLDCCMAYGVNLHTKPALDFDFAVEIVWFVGSGADPGIYQIGESDCPFYASVRPSTDTSIFGQTTSGTGQLLSAHSFTEPWDFGFCLEVTDESSALLGTRLYVPRITIPEYPPWSRLQFFLLSDPTITPIQASTTPLDSLTLATQPWLDLGSVAYFDQGNHEVGLNPGQKLGQVLVSRVGADTIALPFVVVADGVRIYMGSVGTLLSAAASNQPVGPVIITDDITDDSLTILAPWNGTDSRDDPRILNALEETSRLIP